MKITSEKGSIAVIVIVTLLFFLVIVSAAYMINAAMNKSQLKSEQNMKNTYESEFNNINDIYKDLLVNKTIADIKGNSILSETENVAINDTNGNTVTVPAGFMIASDSATTQDDRNSSAG